jgi:hypothetical protein
MTLLTGILADRRTAIITAGFVYTSAFGPFVSSKSDTLDAFRTSLRCGIVYWNIGRFRRNAGPTIFKLILRFPTRIELIPVAGWNSHVG